jgi:hypothetical protein
MQMRCRQANLVRPTQVMQKSRFNGIILARATTLAHLGAWDQEEQTTSLDIYLGTLPVNGDQQQRAPAIFYDFSSRGFPHGNGFAISTGISTLSCQVSGMTLDYSGPPKQSPSALGDIPRGRQ